MLTWSLANPSLGQWTLQRHDTIAKLSLIVTLLDKHIYHYHSTYSKPTLHWRLSTPSSCWNTLCQAHPDEEGARGGWRCHRWAFGEERFAWIPSWPSENMVMRSSSRSTSSCGNNSMLLLSLRQLARPLPLLRRQRQLLRKGTRVTDTYHSKMLIRSLTDKEMEDLKKNLSLWTVGFVFYVQTDFHATVLISSSCCKTSIVYYK